MTRDGVPFVHAVGDNTDENGLAIQIMVSLTFPAEPPFLNHQFLLNFTSTDDSSVALNESSVILGWTPDGGYVDEVLVHYAGVDDLLVDGTQTASVVVGPLVNLSSGEILSGTYTILDISTYDNDGTDST